MSDYIKKLRNRTTVGSRLHSRAVWDALIAVVERISEHPGACKEADKALSNLRKQVES